MSERNAAGHFFFVSLRGACLIAATWACLSGSSRAQSLDGDSSAASVATPTAAADNAAATQTAPGAPNSPAIPGPGSLEPGTPTTTSTGSTDVSGYSTTGNSAAPISGPGATSASSGPGGFFSPNGRIPFHITAVIGESYDDNIFVQPHKTSDELTTLSIKGELRFGDRSSTDSNFLDVYYQPSGILYAQHSSEDTLNQNVDLFYQHRFTRLTLSLEQSYVHAQSTNSAIGNLVTSDTYNTNATVDYAYSDKLDLKGSFLLNVTDFQDSSYTNSREFDGNFYFLYHLDSRLSLGLGPEFGFLDVQQTANQTYQQLLGHVLYVYSGRLTFAADGGAELREYQGTTGNTLTPVFDLTATYTPSPYTILSLSGARRDSPSYNLIGQDYVSTSISVSAIQQFYQKFSLRLSLGYENDDYQAASNNPGDTAREDNYFFVNPGVDYHPNDWLTVSAYYRYQRDDSSFSGFDFNDNQVGLTLSASY
jgi:hypothetical protein